MNKKILAFGASTSVNSINKTLAFYVASKFDGDFVTCVDLNNFTLPLYSIDLETNSGIPQPAYDFERLISDSDGIILSLAEHNGLPSVAFKNLTDWLSRIDKKVWKGKPMLLMATSPGEKGGAGVLAVMKGLIPYAGANVIADFSLPSFYENFSETGINDETLNTELTKKIQQFALQLSNQRS